MKKIDLGKKETIHFIGIGGIGMSGLAQIMKIMGFKIQGSDLNKSINTENCKKLGATRSLKVMQHSLTRLCIKLGV